MYEQTVKLQHNEIAAKVNLETGEFQEVKKRPNNIPQGKILWNPGPFHKRFDASWKYLLNHLTDKEIVIVSKMTLMARPNSNSLEPLSNNSSSEEIAQQFGIHRNSVNKMFNKLFKLGVYAEFRFASTSGIKHYWVLNPYIAFYGKTISNTLADLFRETKFAEIFNDYYK